MNFRATNFSFTVLLLIALTIFMMFVRNKKRLDNSWPLIYWLMVVMFTIVREEDTFQLPIIAIGLLAGMLLRFEFMNIFFIRLVKSVEVVIWCYVIYRGFQIIIT